MKFNALNQMTAKSLGAGKHGDGQGLYLVKARKETGKWIVRLSMGGKRREMGLGRWPDVSIADARESAREARAQVRQGIDPIAERRRQRRSVSGATVAEMVESCFEAKKASLKNDGRAGGWMSPLSVHILPKIGSVPIAEIDQHQLKTVMEPIWHTKPEAARKALNRVKLVIKHAAALGLEVDQQAVANAKEMLGVQRRTVRHFPSLPYQEVPAFYQWLCSVTGTSALALRLLILTAARPGEVRQATFAEVEGDTWILPSERAKTNTEHRKPLTAEAQRVVEEARDIAVNEYLFSSYRGRPLSDAAMGKFMRTHGYEARPHGFRSSFRMWAEEQTDADYAVKEACLGHKVDTGVVGAYQRSDRLEKRRALLIEWQDFVLSI